MVSHKRISGLAGLLLLLLAIEAQATCVMPSTTGIQLQLQGSTTTSNASAYPAWDATQVYTAGGRVTWNSMDYEARWWTQGNAPAGNTGEVWKLLPDINGNPQPWQSTQVYYAGDLSVYQGNVYSAKWWTKGEAPSGGAWAFVRALDPFASIQLAGTDTRYSCSQVQIYGYGSTNYETITWSIAQDPGKVFSYWKQMDNITGTEITRGMTTQGQSESNYGFFTSQVPGGTATTYSGRSVSLYLCNAANDCRKVIPN